MRAAAAQTASERGHKGKHAISLSRSSIEPFLQFSARRDLREQAFKAWRQRGANGGKTDNRKIVAEILSLRAERARLLGFKTAADAALEFTMAKTPANVRKLLMEVWKPARKRAAEERDQLQAAVQAEGGNFKLAGWDWRYYAEKVRKTKFDVDEAEVKPYLQLDNVIAAAFDVATKLFGVSFKERPDLPVYHPDVRSFEVTGKDGRHIGLFLADYFSRPSKRSGAWMSGWRDQHKLDARRGAADHRQRHELRQGRARRADACSASTMRARCSTSSATGCTGCCPTSPIRRCRAPAWRGTSWSCPRSSTSTG